jgi:hypothetical protein
MTGKRKFFVGTLFVALMAALGIGQALLDNKAEA